MVIPAGTEAAGRPIGCSRSLPKKGGKITHAITWLVAFSKDANSSSLTLPMK
jgi:hypothetical protein